MELWKVIPGFSGYSVSNQGRIKNNRSGRFLATDGQRAAVLRRDGKSHGRSIALIVARAFLPPPPNEAFDTPIHLNGNDIDNRAENLMWRPRWFANRFIREIRRDEYRGWRCPLMDTETREIFPHPRAIAERYGVLQTDVREAALQESEVWPTDRRFRMMYSKMWES